MAKKITDKIKKLRRDKKLGKVKMEKELIPEELKDKSIIKQIQDEYTSAWRFTRPKIQEGLVRLKLYNNQKRDKDRVGDPLIYTIFQTVLSALYNDHLGVEFIGREEGDQDVAENLNGLAKFDYDEMDKAKHDYDWIFDSMAFGRGLSYFNEFDVESKTPIPEVWDPLTFIRDPNAISVNGNRRGNGALRFGGREVVLTKGEMESNNEYFNLGKLKPDNASNALSLTQEASQARNEAQNVENQITSPSDSFKVLQWFTIIDGEKYLAEVANERSLLIRLQPIESGNWPLIDRPFSPMSHDWDGVSIFDILEDKQRFRASLLNVLGDVARADLYPMYLFDETKIRKSIDKNFQFNKWIPVDGPVGDAARPLQKAQPSQISQFVLDFLSSSSERALATPEVQQGQLSGEKRTLGEIELVASKVEGRYSLTARVFGWSEKEFWKRWYEIYDRDFSEGIQKKTVRIMGSFGPQWRDISRDEIIVSNLLGPDIQIESRIISEAKKARAYLMSKDYFGLAMGSPTADKMYGLRKLGRLLMPKDEVERLLPLNVDERRAQQENEKLNEDERVAIAIDDDHIVHLRLHSSAKDNEATKAHIKAHDYVLMQKRMAPMAFPQVPSDMGMPIPEQTKQQMVAPEGTNNMASNMSPQT